MKNKTDYSKYKCPYSHLEKDCGHELKGPEGYENVYGVWCACGYRAPIFYLDPDELNFRLKDDKCRCHKFYKYQNSYSFCPDCGRDLRNDFNYSG